MNYSLYLHIPFCVRRCAYCDFNTYARQETLIPDYVEALCREVEAVARAAPERLTAHTIFFGGGTPSLLSPRHFERILTALQSHFSILSEAEISLEANPGAVTLASLRDLRALGFNRISFGVQSFHPEELRQLERIHNPFDVFDAVRWARRAGFDNLNLDLIYGLPEQSLDRWAATVQWALSLAPEHLSLYALTIEPGTPFGRWVARGLLPLPDPDLAAEMYTRAGEWLEAKGYEQYEISNWARPGFQCRHNLQYWRNQPYLGFGAGAHGYADNMRVANILRIRSYIERCRSPVSLPFPLSPAAVHKRVVSRRVEMQETMMTGLRLTREGVSAREFACRFGVEVTDVFGAEIEKLLGLGLLEWVQEKDDRILRLTPSARLLGNQVFLHFVD